MKIATHNGSYHTDEIFAVAALLKKFPGSEIIRSREESVIKSADIAVDVGLEYDPLRLKFDHHMPGGVNGRENGIPFASFGLVWKEYGEEIAGTKEAQEIIEETLVYPIDAIDNGVAFSKPMVEGLHEYTIGDYLKSFSYKADTLQELDEAFVEALEVARDVLEKELAAAQEKVVAWKKVREIYESSNDKRIIVLPETIPWKKILIPTEAMFVITKRYDGTFQARAVPAALNSFELKKPFPKEWGGKSDEDLRKISGVDDATFCHKDLFLAGSESQEGAIKLADLALEN